MNVKGNHQFTMTNRSITAGFWCKICDYIDKALERVQTLAEKKGGKCLADDYLNTRTKMLFQCEKEHNFELTAEQLRLGKWCLYPNCQ